MTGSGFAAHQLGASTANVDEAIQWLNKAAARVTTTQHVSWKT